MAAWTADELDRIGRAEELQVSSMRDDGSLRPFVTIWVVRVDDQIYIRSAFGPRNGWFVRALASGYGRIKAGGIEKDVTFGQVGGEVNDAITAAYHTKYDQHGPRIVGTVTGTDVGITTIQVIPREG